MHTDQQRPPEQRQKHHSPPVVPYRARAPYHEDVTDYHLWAYTLMNSPPLPREDTYLRLKEYAGHPRLACNEVIESIEERVRWQSIWREEKVDKTDQLRDF